jgi:prepilin-type processing-associated H-X9-DG protein
MGRTFKIALAVLALVLVSGLFLTMVMRGRVNSDRVNCQNHLKDIGLYGVRHASLPGKEMPTKSLLELPPGTVPHELLPPDQRLSWYPYTLNLLLDGLPGMEKHIAPRGLPNALQGFDVTKGWDNESNVNLARYRLSTAICPAQVPKFEPGAFITTNYIAMGGLGLDTPKLSRELAGPLAGSYRYDGATTDAMIKDGLQETAQFIETNVNLGPWLQGGTSTLRGLDTSATPYLGQGRPFGGCHPEGAYVSFVDGSVRFVRETIDPIVFRALWTIDGGDKEIDADIP